jgi:biotin transporter BioY
MKTTRLTLGDCVLPRVGNGVLALLRVLILSVGLAVATGLAATVKFEIGLIPVTFQTFAVLMSGILFGSRIGAASQLTYLLAGLAGVPWFSRGGGIGYLLSPTFGYVVGFVAAAYVVGLLAERGWDKSIAGAVGAMAAGIAVIYYFGLIWLAKFVPSESLLAVGIYPFLAADFLKIVAAGLVLPLCRKATEDRLRSDV